MSTGPLLILHTASTTWGGDEYQGVPTYLSDLHPIHSHLSSRPAVCVEGTDSQDAFSLLPPSWALPLRALYPPHL